jgi:methionyl-tRNA formyltransferase
MRIAFLGTPDFAVPSLAALIGAGHEIVCVYSQPAAPRGRGQSARPSPVQAFAETRGLAVRTPPSLKEAEAAEPFRALGLDAAVVVAFGQILTPEILDAPRLGCFNLHASLLPRWRGAAPIQRAIMAGDAVTGAQVMRMTPGLDEGPVLGSTTLRIDALETAGTLHDRLSLAGADLVARVMASVADGTSVVTPQPDEGATYAKKIKSAEARVRWDRPARRVDRQIRGLSPYPGAWFTVASDRGSVRVKALLSTFEDVDGETAVALDERLLIGCKAGAVRLLRVQREGRAPQDAADFLRGFPIPAGTVLA